MVRRISNLIGIIKGYDSITRAVHIWLIHIPVFLQISRYWTCFITKRTWGNAMIESVIKGSRNSLDLRRGGDERSPEPCKTNYVALLSSQIVLIDSALATTLQVALYWHKGRKYTRWEISVSSIFSQRKTTNATNFPRTVTIGTRRTKQFDRFVSSIHLCFLEILFFFTPRRTERTYVVFRVILREITSRWASHTHCLLRITS